MLGKATQQNQRVTTSLFGVWNLNLGEGLLFIFIFVFVCVWVCFGISV